METTLVLVVVVMELLHHSVHIALQLVEMVVVVLTKLGKVKVVKVLVEI